MKKLSTILKFIATGSMSLILSACYGVQYQIENRSMKVKVKAQNSKNESLAGIGISWGSGEKPAGWHQAGTTDSLGICTVECEIPDGDILKIKAEDIDGDKNGIYVSKIITVDDTAETVVLDQL